jgi:shikimate dehydrogenase
MKTFAILGDPVAHSLSPIFQSAAFRAAGISAEYVPLPTQADFLSDAIERIRRGILAGANVTIPHKRAVLPLVDVLTEEATAVKAVNWLGMEEGKLVGHNTDLAGFMRSLEEAGIGVSGKMAAVFGAGGAARAAVLALLRMGASRVVVGARRPEEGTRLAAELGAAAILPMSLLHARSTALSADLVVSAVPPDAWADVAPPAIAQDAWVIDLAYDPRGTPAERWAMTKGARALNGISMLLHQGALSFERWTGEPFPMDAAKDSILGERTPPGTDDGERTPPRG